MKSGYIFTAANLWYSNLSAIKFILILALTINVAQIYAQTTYVIDGEPQLKVSGTSTIHDWEMESYDASGTAKIVLENSKLLSIDFLKVTLPVISLKSGKGQMDTNAYKALRAEHYPDIFFELTAVEKIIDQKILVKARLIITGTSRSKSLEVNYTILENGIQFSGDCSIRFSDFNIDPPSAVFGTIKTGDDLTLSFNAIFKHTSKITKQ